MEFNETHFVRLCDPVRPAIDLDLNDISYATFGTRVNPDTNQNEKTLYIFFKSSRYILLTGAYVDDYDFKMKKLLK